MIREIDVVVARPAYILMWVTLCVTHPTLSHWWCSHAHIINTKWVYRYCVYYCVHMWWSYYYRWCGYELYVCVLVCFSSPVIHACHSIYVRMFILSYIVDNYKLYYYLVVSTYFCVSMHYDRCVVRHEYLHTYISVFTLLNNFPYLYHGLLCIPGWYIFQWNNSSSYCIYIYTTLYNFISSAVITHVVSLYIV